MALSYGVGSSCGGIPNDAGNPILDCCFSLGSPIMMPKAPCESAPNKAEACPRGRCLPSSPQDLQRCWLNAHFDKKGLSAPLKLLGMPFLDVLDSSVAHALAICA